VSWVGHIRVFTVLAASATAALLLIGLIQQFEFWLIARLITGWSIAGIYMVIESWLNERTNVENRGLMLSIYTTLTLVSISIGQMLVGINLDNFQLISLGAILLSLGAVPVGLTRSPAPNPIPSVRFQLKKVYAASHVAVGGTIAGGLVTSGFWVLGPLVAEAKNLTSVQIGYFMAATLLGGAILQLPVGRMSDKFDRRYVLVGLSIAAIITCIAITFFGEVHPAIMISLMFLFGGTTFPLYSISLAHANDHTTLPLIETGSIILLLNSAGAVVGPAITAQLMGITSNALFIFAAFVLTLFSIWAIGRIVTHPATRPHFEPFTGTPMTTHEVMAVIDPDLSDIEVDANNQVVYLDDPKDDLETEIEKEIGI
jgi:MFS family permease